MRSPKIKIRHLDWLRTSKNTDHIRKLILDGTLPKALAGWSLVVAVKHDLRAVYGSDLRAALALLASALADKWEAFVTEPAARGFFFLRYGLAWCVWRTWSKFIVLRGFLPVWGRDDSPEPLLCACGWGGMRRQVIHTYQDDGTGQDEVEPVDECPRCGQEI